MKPNMLPNLDFALDAATSNIHARNGLN